MIVIVSDGRDENNPGTGRAAGGRSTRSTAREVDAAIFSIGIGPNVDRGVLEMLAGASGGEAYFPQDVTQLDAEYQRVVETLRRRWMVTYLSTDTERNGQWRRSRSRRAIRTSWFAAAADISRHESRQVMDTSGRPHEGWMIVIPGTVFLMFVVLALGGPVGFVNTLSLWAVETANWFVNWFSSAF